VRGERGLTLIRTCGAELFGTNAATTTLNGCILVFMAKKQLGQVDAELLRRVDEVRGDVPRVRWVERALERAVSMTEALSHNPAVAVEQALGESRRGSGRSETAPKSPALRTDAPGHTKPDVPPAPAESPASYRCPDDCMPSWRTHSYLMRCPKCRCKVVPA
jgi:hypothetical protein